MGVKNYYRLSDRERAECLENIRQWLFLYPQHEKTQKALFALEVCYTATKLEKDEFIDTVIDKLT
jgi:DNA-binding PadR family transcriptional regulator